MLEHLSPGTFMVHFDSCFAAVFALAACSTSAAPVGSSGPLDDSLKPQTSANGTGPSAPPGAPRAAAELPDELPKPPDEDLRSLRIASNSLGFELLANVSTTGNVALAPASAAFALGMTAFGARGESAVQMKKVLHFEGEDGARARAYAWVLRSWFSRPRAGIRIEFLQRIFAEGSLTLEPTFRELTRSRFAAELQEVPFVTAPEVVRALINNWAETVTQRRVSALLPAGSVTENTRLGLVSAFHFKAPWREPFSKAATLEGEFFVGGTDSVKVPLMHATGLFSHADGETATLLEVPYEGGEFAMGFVLPKEKNGLATVEAKLDATALEAWTRKLVVTRVALALPRWTFAPAVSQGLKEPLVKLGMASAFDPTKADFSGIVIGTEPLALGDLFQKLFVSIDELGTEAAVATAVTMVAAGAHESPALKTSFVVDRPFLFYVRDSLTGVLLLLGRITDPRR